MMILRKSHFVLAIALISISGCSPKSDEVDKLKAQVETLQKTVDTLKLNQDLEDVFSKIEKIAYLTPGGDGYSMIAFDLGHLTVQIADVAPYANGSKVSLRFGNPLSAAITGVKAKIEWGKVDAKGNAENESAHSKEVDWDNQIIRAGAWTRVDTILEGVPPAELGFVRVSELTHKGLSLSGY